jgi:AcrR family transcriptional regulator
MKKRNGSSLWVEAGYDLFAREGMNGIQVERLARILQRNKSGFYHYFGDMETFSSDLVRLHKRKSDEYITETRSISSIDPDYLNIVVKYKVPILFQIQCYRSANATFCNMAEKIDQHEDLVLRAAWADYLGFGDNPDLANRFFNIIRDMFYGRATDQNFDLPFLQTIVREAKSLVQQIAGEKANSSLDTQNEPFGGMRKVGSFV